MPNWCTSWVTFCGPRADADALRALMTADRQEFDFYALLPPPKGIPYLCLPTETAYEIKFGNWKQAFAHRREKPLSREQALEQALASTGWPVFDSPKEFERLAKRGRSIAKRFGYPGRSAWCIAHWGTDRNCSDCYWLDAAAKDGEKGFPFEHDEVHGVRLDTAWAPPLAFMKALSRRFPTLTLRMWFSSWDYRGDCTFSAGEMSNEVTSSDAFADGEDDSVEVSRGEDSLQPAASSASVDIVIPAPKA